MNNTKQYNIGLDIGTNSVGWAVTDMNNNLLKHQKQNMWGSRLFNSAETAVERRGFRSTRRRMNRRKQRLALLRELMASMIEQVDPAFYARLASTQLHQEDSAFKQVDNYNLFIDKAYNDQDYFNDYPTMYHLRNELMNGKGKTQAMDSRLIYLAASHLLKYRGNFLYEGQDLQGVTNAFDTEFSEFAELLNDTEWLSNTVTSEQIQAIMLILQDTQLYRSQKAKDAVAVLGTLDQKVKKQWEQVFKGIIGLSIDTKQLFDENFVNESGKALTFDMSKYEDTKDALATLLQDDIEILDSLEKMYSWYVLQGVLSGQASLTAAMIAKYDQHKSDLALLKQAVRTHCDMKTYTEFFRNDEAKAVNYVNYIKKTFVENAKAKAKKTCSQEDLYKEIKKIFKGHEVAVDVKAIFAAIDSENFLPKQNSTDNGAIPYQLQLSELQMILTNQSQFYPELAEVSEKIVKILTFRIPYYVGPLTSNEKSDFAWVEFKGEGRIYPWNFDELIDSDTSAEKFIERMRSTCTYIIGEPVFPRYSLLYNEYVVLNELNKVKVDGEFIRKVDKFAIIEQYFKMQKTVSKKDIAEYCTSKWGKTYKSEDVTGTQGEKNFASNMGSYVDMAKIFGYDFVDNNTEVIEQLIEWLTVFEDKKIIKRKIEQVYPELVEYSAKLTRLRYSGWSNLSRKLLVDVKSEVDGINLSIIDLLRSTNANFMQLINDDRYKFKEFLEHQLGGDDKKAITYKEIKALAGSPALKRGIWQTVQIVQEIEKVIGQPPANIFIEFAREDQASKRTNSRLNQLQKLYDTMDSNLELVNLRKQLNDVDNKDITNRMFLYYTQNGKCAYSGKPLNLNDLNLYQIDHILPQSLIKDDSIDNTVLVLAEMNQAKAGKKTALDVATPQAKKMWELLKTAGLMTQRKYANLTTRELSSDRLKGFINRQLVEMRQISKHVAQLLERSTSANVYSLKATLASQFRSQFGLAKSRAVNDYHHAHDAYLSALIGNYVQQRYPKLDSEFLYKGYLAYNSASFDKMRHYKYGFIISSMKTVFADQETGEVIVNEEGDVVWRGEEDVAKVRTYFSYKDCFITKKLEENTGQLWNLNPLAKKPGIHSRKVGMDSAKYGGYEGVNSAYSVIYTCERVKGKQTKVVQELLGIPVEYAKIAQQQSEKIQEYIISQVIEKHEQKGWTVQNVRVLKDKILKNQLFELDGGRYTLASPSEWNNAKQLIVPMDYINMLNELERKQDEDKQAELSQKMIEFYDYFVEKLEMYPLFGGVGIKLQDNKTKFANLTYDDKKATLQQLLNITKASPVTGRLKAGLGLNDATGRIMNKPQTISTHLFIDQSVTGMYNKKWQVIEGEVHELANGHRNKKR